MGPDVMTYIFQMLSFKPAFSLSSSIFIKKLFSSSSLYDIIVVSSAYLRLFIFFLAILIPACDSSSLEFHMMYSAYKLNKQGVKIQPWCTPFPILNSLLFHVHFYYCFLAYLQVSQGQVRYSGILISLRVSHSLLWTTKSKALMLVNKAEVDVVFCFALFLEFPCLFYYLWFLCLFKIRLFKILLEILSSHTAEA